MGNNERFRVLWVTNYAAPYRRPVWRAIGTKAELDVVTLESDDDLRREQRRARDWAAEDEIEVCFSIHAARSRVLGRGERKLYVALEKFRLHGALPQATLIGGWESPAYWQALFDAKVSGIRTVGFYESTLATQHHTTGLIAWARRIFFRSLDAIVVPGAAAHDAVVQMGVREDRVYTGFNAIDVEKFRRPTGRTEHPIRGGHRFIYVGQLIERKNIRALLEAFSAARHPDDTLTIIGGGEHMTVFREHARLLGVDDAVTFIGAVQYADLPALLWEASHACSALH
jgi:glycosyltransferase involved in cell wall biosynthesis